MIEEKEKQNVDEWILKSRQPLRFETRKAYMKYKTSLVLGAIEKIIIAKPYYSLRKIAAELPFKTNATFVMRYIRKRKSGS